MPTPKQNYHFRCGDIVEGCSWVASAGSKEELLSKIEKHGGEQHNMGAIDPETREKVEGAIVQEAA